MTIPLERFRKIIAGFSRARIAVVGDLTVDVYVYGQPYRLSREAPVVILRYEGEDLVPGSGANVVNNLWKLGAKVYPVGTVGDDEPGRKLREYFRDGSVAVEGIVVERGTFTTTKTRVLAGDHNTSKQQMVRIDREPREIVSEESERMLLERLEAVLPEVDGVVVSDYGERVVTRAIIERICAAAREKLVVVDSRHRIEQFHGVAVVTPNELEAEQSAGATIEDDESLLHVGRRLLARVGSQAVLITRGNKGMSLFERDGIVSHIPIAGSKEVTDVTGAGDTVAATMALGLVSGAAMHEAARLANYAAGVVVMKRGAATLTVEELHAIIERDYENC